MVSLGNVHLGQKGLGQKWQHPDNGGSGYASLPPPTRNIDHADSSQQHGKRKRLDYLLQSAVESISETFGVRESSPIEHDT